MDKETKQQMKELDELYDKLSKKTRRQIVSRIVELELELEKKSNG